MQAFCFQFARTFNYAIQPCYLFLEVSLGNLGDTYNFLFVYVYLRFEAIQALLLQLHPFEKTLPGEKYKCDTMELWEDGRDKFVTGFYFLIL